MYVNSEVLYFSRTEREITRFSYLTDMDQNETWKTCNVVHATRSTRSLGGNILRATVCNDAHWGISYEENMFKSLPGKTE